MESGGGRTESRPLTAEEEAVKRNTDCVYFLASPLTCKKGNECEYRHSEGARINPRDCWYWLNSNCLNPKCSFRHPPLDALFGTPGKALVPAPLPSQSNGSTQVSMAHASVFNLNKQTVPCIYFQKGQCLKGEKCPFMHEPQPTGNPNPQRAVKASPSISEQPQTLKKDSGGIKQFSNHQNITKASANKPVEAHLSSAKSARRAESAPKNDLLQKRSLLSCSFGSKLPGPQPAHAPINNRNALSKYQEHQVHPLDAHLQNGRVAEFVGKSSPGFDVFADDNIKGNGYLHSENGFRRASAQSGRKGDPVNDYGHQHSDYEHVSRYERDQFKGSVGEFERPVRIADRFALKPHKSFSERILDRPLLTERRVMQRHESPDEVGRSDLRHRLLKQRRLTGSKSTVSPDRHGETYHRGGDNYTEDRYQNHHPNRDQQQFPLDGSVSTRLRGRITLPSGSSLDAPRSLLSEKERGRARPRGKLSPARPISYEGRQRDRERQRSTEDPHFAVDARAFGGHPTRREHDADTVNFAGPKSLAELKGAKAVESFEEQSTNSTIGPKPLNAILKRKREDAPEHDAASSSGYENGCLSAGNENNQKIGDARAGSFVTAAVAEVQYVEEFNKEDISTVSGIGEPNFRTVEKEEEEEEEEGLIHSGDEEVIHRSQSSVKEYTPEARDDMEIDTAEDQELQNSGHRDVESDYESGDIKREDENTYQGDDDDEELDDEDDDFARKVGILFS